MTPTKSWARVESLANLLLCLKAVQTGYMYGYGVLTPTTDADHRHHLSPQRLGEQPSKHQKFSHILCIFTWTGGYPTWAVSWGGTGGLTFLLHSLLTAQTSSMHDCGVCTHSAHKKREWDLDTQQLGETSGDLTVRWLNTTNFQPTFGGCHIFPKSGHSADKKRCCATPVCRERAPYCALWMPHPWLYAP